MVRTRSFPAAHILVSVGAQVAGRRVAATTGSFASACSALRVRAGCAPAALSPRSERDPQPGWAALVRASPRVDGGHGRRAQNWADHMKANRKRSRKRPERAPKVQMSCVSAQPEKIWKNILSAHTFLFRYLKRGKNSLFGSGLTFPRFHDGQDLSLQPPRTVLSLT